MGPDTPVRFFELSPENYMRRGGLFPELLSEVCEHHEVLTHGLSLNIGSTDPLDRDYLDRLAVFLAELGATSHSDHLCWNGNDALHLHDLLPLPTTDRAAAHVADRILRAQDRLRRPLSLENISYYLLPGGSMPEHEFLARVLEAADCKLLLDVNNVWVNAQNHGFDPYDYLRAIPLDRVDRMHVAGGERLCAYDGLVIDTHGADVGTPVAEMMEWVVERIGPVPVTYERDHEIPPLSILLQHVADLQGRYNAALGRHRRAVEDVSGRRERISYGLGSVELAHVETGLCRAILDRSDVDNGLPERLSNRSLPEAAVDLIASWPTARIAVYRRLVRNTLHKTVLSAFERTASRRGPGFDDDVADWLASCGPQSPYLHDVAREFVAWAAERWPNDAAVPAYLLDLLRHELLEWDVAAMPLQMDGPEDPTRFSLDSRLAFADSVLLADYQWRVHELVDDVQDRSLPIPGETYLLAYRDAEHDVRYLELTPLAWAVLSRLRLGELVREAISFGAASLGIPLDDGVLSRVGTVLAELVERGVIVAPAG